MSTAEDNDEQFGWEAALVSCWKRIFPSATSKQRESVRITAQINSFAEDRDAMPLNLKRCLQTYNHIEDECSVLSLPITVLAIDGAQETGRLILQHLEPLTPTHHDNDVSNDNDDDYYYDDDPIPIVSICAIGDSSAAMQLHDAIQSSELIDPEPTPTNTAPSIEVLVEVEALDSAWCADLLRNALAAPHAINQQPQQQEQQSSIAYAHVQVDVISIDPVGAHSARMIANALPASVRSTMSEHRHDP